MKHLLLAGSLVLSLALVRPGARAEQSEAYGSLVGMADAAAADKGPEAGELPSDRPQDDRGRPESAAEAPKPGFAARAVARGEAKPVAPAPRRESAKDDDAPSVAVPAKPSPRVWTRLFSSLLPPMTRASAFEVAVSTSARRVRPAPAATAASAAGSAQGILELVAAATAPVAP